jgi:hypothetical protein
MQSHAPALLVSALAWHSFSCADCDRSGCDSLTQAATPVETGIAGVVAVSSDVVSDGCHECPLGDATLQIWRVEAATTLSTEEAVATFLAEHEPDMTENVSKRYSRPLAPAAYLLCVRPNCIGLNVAAAETLTVNIQRRDGPTGFFIGRSSSGALEEDFGFEVGY